MTIAYRFHDNLYLNITNRCNCSCTFCIRRESSSVGDGENLWLEHEPSLSEILCALDAHDLTQYSDIVFCGYGEPTERLELIPAICRHIREKTGELCPRIRLDTNGLSDLMYGRDTVPELAAHIDCVSISLNAPNVRRYAELVRPEYGPESYAAMLSFAGKAAEAFSCVYFSVVNVLSEDEIQACREISERMGIPLRVRVQV